VSRVLPVPLAATGEEIVEIVRAGIRPGRTRLLIVDQLTSATARVFPAAAIVGVAHEHGVPVLVDAAHVPGMLPVTVGSVGADFWVGNLHNGGTPRASPPYWWWTARGRNGSDRWWSPGSRTGFPRRVEWRATLDYTSWLAAPSGSTRCAASAWTGSTHNAALAAYGQRVVGDALGVTPADLPDPGGPAVAMRIIPLPPGTATTLDAARALRARIAERLGAEVAVNAWDGRGWLRLCGQVYNSAQEYERLAVRLPPLLAQR
jgi:isopenicillin-N epimerase